MGDRRRQDDGIRDSIKNSKGFSYDHDHRSVFFSSSPGKANKSNQENLKNPTTSIVHGIQKSANLQVSKYLQNFQKPEIRQKQMGGNENKEPVSGEWNCKKQILKRAPPNPITDSARAVSLVCNNGCVVPG